MPGRDDAIDECDIVPVVVEVAVGVGSQLGSRRSATPPDSDGYGVKPWSAVTITAHFLSPTCLSRNASNLRSASSWAATVSPISSDVIPHCGRRRPTT